MGIQSFLFSKKSHALCLHQFDLLHHYWTCMTIRTYRDYNMENRAFEIQIFVVLKGKYNPKTTNNMIHVSYPCDLNHLINFSGC
jgi:hypothetical protein